MTSHKTTISSKQTTLGGRTPPDRLGLQALQYESDADFSHLHATLLRIDEIANHDVEMAAPLAESATYIVVDTNILLKHFDVLTRFVEDVERLMLPVVMIIPGIVIHELDGKKKDDGLGWASRRASAWLLIKVQERRTVKGQANEETCKPSRNWKVKNPQENIIPRERINDSLILDCCAFFQRERRTFLCSEDKNLCIESISHNIPTITPGRRWSSREIAWAVFRDYVRLDYTRFEAYQMSYKEPKDLVTAAAAEAAAPTTLLDADEDTMMVDDDNDNSQADQLHLQPSHALDLLHIQVIEHFTRLLVELVGRVGGSELDEAIASGTAASRFAPEWQRRGIPRSQWTAKDCVEYLNGRKAVPGTNPRAEVFLSKPYSCAGARRGQDWSRQDWIVALESLGRTGDNWEDVSIRESLWTLSPHFTAIFGSKMRPTGI